MALPQGNGSSNKAETPICEMPPNRVAVIIPARRAMICYGSVCDCEHSLYVAGREVVLYSAADVLSVTMETWIPGWRGEAFRA